MQSSSVVRGSMFSWWSLPLMRSVTGTAPSIFDPALVTAESLSSAGLFASAGTYAATKLAATPLPEVKRNLRRVGFGGRALGSSSDIGLRSYRHLWEFSFRGSSFEFTYAKPSGPIAVTCEMYSPDFAQ